MEADELRALQAPLKERYKSDPAAAAIRSGSVRIHDPTAGAATACSGQSQNAVRPTIISPRPRACTISVFDGASEIMRMYSFYQKAA